MKAADIARFTEESWRKERDRMIAACREGHSVNFAKQELAKGDDMVKEAGRLMAEAIRVVAGLYADRTIPHPKDCAAPFPDLLTFQDAPTVITQRLFVMFMEHRMRAFQGAVHASPGCALWYAWSELRRDLTEIQELATDMRAIKRFKPARGTVVQKVAPTKK